MYTFLLFYMITADVKIDGITSIVSSIAVIWMLNQRREIVNCVSPSLSKGKRIASILTDFPDPKPKKVIRYNHIM